MKRISPVLFLFLLVASGVAGAQSSPVGRWKTFDDDTGQAKSIIRIAENHGVLEGKIESLLDPEEPADARCELCPGERRGQRVVGLGILGNLRQSAGTGKWEGGEILDPENGKTYRASVTLSPDGRRLDVRAYIGTPLLGRTQRWQRVD